VTSEGPDPAPSSIEPGFYSRPSLHVEIYDALEREVPGGDDIGFFRGLALRTGGRVLELGCGSGRVTCPLAEAGVTIVGVDRSRAMLDVAETRRRDLPADVRRRLRFVEADITDLRVGRGFGLVFAAFRVFMCLLDPEAQLAALATARRHLRPGGLLALDLFDPRLDLLAGEAWAVRPMGEVRNPVTGRRVVVDVVERRNDLLMQRFTERWRFVEFDDGGDPVREEYETLALRWTFRSELEHLLARAGFELVAEMSDFAGSPPAYGKEIIVIARRPGRAG
jgi:SAM-dependent methyltransferase